MKKNVRRIVNLKRTQISMIFSCSDSMTLIDRVLDEGHFSEQIFPNKYTNTVYFIDSTNTFPIGYTPRFRFFSNKLVDFSIDRMTSGIFNLSQYEGDQFLINVEKRKANSRLDQYTEVFDKLSTGIILPKLSAKYLCQYKRRCYENDFSRITIDFERKYSILVEKSDYFCITNRINADGCKVEYKFFKSDEDILEAFYTLGNKSATNVEILKSYFE